MKPDFRPPLENKFLIRSVYLALPLIMRARSVVGQKIPERIWITQGEGPFTSQNK